MKDELKLSRTIVERVPKSRRKDNLSCNTKNLNMFLDKILWSPKTPGL